MANKKYDNNSISMLKGADRVRLRPAVIFGSDGLEGCEHAVFEIISNSIDEAREGHGNKIIITRYLDKSIEVQDFGRGCPVDWNESEQRYNWELVFCELYAGGKYDTDGSNYEFSLGLNGLGACATQYASDYFDAEIIRDKKKYLLHFEKGENIGGLKVTKALSSVETGSKFHWLPDREVFTDINIPLNYYTDMLQRQSVVNPGITFVLRNETEEGFEETIFYHENGILDYVTEITKNKSFTMPQYWEGEKMGRDRKDMDDYKVKMTAAICFSNDINLLEYYHNSSWLEYGGAPDKAVKSAFISEIDAYIKKENKYNKGESKITFQDISDSLVLVTNCFSLSAFTSYENQTKKAVTNKFIQEAMTTFFREKLEIYFIENKNEADKIINQILINKRARESAEKTKIKVKKDLTRNVDINNRVQKFVDCRSKDTSIRELYIVEGDSALGSVKLSRDAEFQGIMPVRGKILNCLKVDYGRIFKSEIITDLMKVIGCGVELTGGKKTKDLPTFNINNLRWNKIIICTDADVDGYQIRTLILTMIYRLCPTLIKEGYVYIAESPLYEINYKEKTYFAYSNKEKDDIVKSLGTDKRIFIQRSKGLGENDPEMMSLTTMNPKTRKLIKITPEEATETAKWFELLEGNDLAGRKDYLAEHGHEYLELADIM